MDANKADLNDKENIAPASDPIHWPALPKLSPKVIHGPQGAPSTKQAHANIARKRHRLAALTDTPPRPSHASQMSNIFAKSSPYRAYHRAMSFATPDHPKTGHAYRPKPMAASTGKDTHLGIHSPAPTHPYSPGSVSSSSADSPEKDAPNDLERAVAMSFSSLPSREERRKTLNIELSPPKDQTSTDEWTGDDIFFRREPQVRTDNQNKRPAQQNISMPMRGLNMPQPQRMMPRPSRFCVQMPPSRSTVGFASHAPAVLRPASASDDADDEATESEMEI